MTRRAAGPNGAQSRAPLKTAARPVRTPVTRQVVDALFDLLRSGQYRVGDRLPSEWELVQQLNVGRSAVREAMRELSVIGLIEISAGRGTFVRSLRPDLLLRPESFRDAVDLAVELELLEVRMMLEPEAAAVAATRATPGDVFQLARDVERLREAVRAGYRPPEDLGFHLDLMRATHNSALSRVAGAITLFYKRTSDALPTERDVDEHNEIYEAVRDGDADRARLQTRRHLAVEEVLLRRAVQAEL